MILGITGIISYLVFVECKDVQFSMQILIGEVERVKRCKGRVFALQDEPEVYRVWLISWYES